MTRNGNGNLRAIFLSHRSSRVFEKYIEVGEGVVCRWIYRLMSELSSFACKLE